MARSENRPQGRVVDRRAAPNAESGAGLALSGRYPASAEQRFGAVVRIVALVSANAKEVAIVATNCDELSGNEDPCHE